MNSKKTIKTTETEIPTIATTQLEGVTGGCGACGNASCKPIGAQPTSGAAPGAATAR